MGLSHSDLLLLMDAFESSEWTEMVVSIDGTRLELSSTGLPPDGRREAVPELAVPAAPPRPDPGSAPEVAVAAAAAAAPGAHEVRAPSVGIFYRAPAPDAPPFVSEGARVEPDDIVCIVEVMKLMNHVKAGAAGVVRGIHVDDATMIEHGQLLFTIDSSA